MNCKRLLSLIFILFLCGCVMARSYDLKPVAQLPKEQLNISLNIRTKKTMEINGARYNFKNISKMANDATIKAFQQSGLFEAVGSDISKPDYELELRIKTDTFDMMSAFTIFTLGLLPAYTSTELTIDAKLINKHTNESKTIFLKENYYVWTQLFLVFAMPKHGVEEKAVQLDKDMFDNLIINTYNKIKQHQYNKLIGD